ncbi:MAG TPA: hypothetical protein DCZ30_00035, partial [Clostridiales bacterium]|nr:hypothetical protein [Clostridiales bacterium]
FLIALKAYPIKQKGKIIIGYLQSNKIVISSADRGAHIVLKFLNKIRNKKELYYFVIGGALYNNIIEKKWDVNVYKDINKIYVEANTLKENLRLININNVEVLNNFRKINKFKNNYIKKQDIRFVFWGRVIKEKGIEEAIRLINRLNKEGYQCCLDIYGQIKEDYKQDISKMLNQHIVYKGEIRPDNKNEYEILSMYDIFILPTEYPGECLPGALIDAYISALAVVVSNWKYANEYVRSGENGIIFEYKNYEDMYMKTKKMIDENKIQQYKNKSLEMSKEYNIEIILKEFNKRIVE